MATVLARFTEIQAQQEERYMGFREELRIIGTAMGTIVLALHRIEDALRDHGAPHRAPVTRPDQEHPTTSAGASGQEVPTPRQPPRTPLPAEEQPPRKRSLRPKKKTRVGCQDPRQQDIPPQVFPLSHIATLSNHELPMLHPSTGKRTMHL
ncbi:hypothetical protein NDU88_000592 [Pleurodeles waltl]|uniref:Uncharacterized protein n=1 Tax=Pleurodeles waltl TaxID=8319 RepID=A0AAV7KMD9_PLEWA|nr:hypothetical protein NDU88_000592 [Pleurodeles waltl]